MAFFGLEIFDFVGFVSGLVVFWICLFECWWFGVFFLVFWGAFLVFCFLVFLFVTAPISPFPIKESVCVQDVKVVTAHQASNCIASRIK